MRTAAVFFGFALSIAAPTYAPPLTVPERTCRVNYPDTTVVIPAPVTVQREAVYYHQGQSKLTGFASVECGA